MAFNFIEKNNKIIVDFAVCSKTFFVIRDHIEVVEDKKVRKNSDNPNGEYTNLVEK